MTGLQTPFFGEFAFAGDRAYQLGALSNSLLLIQPVYSNTDTSSIRNFTLLNCFDTQTVIVACS
jgi:hypothetical protein